MTGWRCWVCYRCKIVSYHHVPGNQCPTCPNYMEFESDADGSKLLMKHFPCSKLEDGWVPYEWSPEFSKAGLQPWGKRTDKETQQARGYGPPAPTTTRERQNAWYKAMFPSL